MENGVELIWSKKQIFKPGHTTKSHTHRYYHLMYFYEGDSAYLINGNIVPLHKGSCFLIPPTLPHESLGRKTLPGGIYGLHLLINDPFLTERLSTNYMLIENCEVFKEYFEYIDYNWNSDDPQNKAVINHILYAILTRFFIDDLNYGDKIPSHIFSDRYDRLTKDMMLYLESNYTKDLILDVFAKKMNYNKSYLCSVFKKNTGLTIINYITMLRIRVALIYLMFYVMDMKTIANALNFSSPSYYSRSFKSLVGVSPIDAQRVFDSLSPQERLDLIRREPLLNYTRCEMAEFIDSFRSIGQFVAEKIKSDASAAETE